MTLTTQNATEERMLLAMRKTPQRRKADAEAARAAQWAALPTEKRLAAQAEVDRLAALGPRQREIEHLRATIVQSEARIKTLEAAEAAAKVLEK